MTPHRSRRCSRCEVQWPTGTADDGSAIYDPCPECGGKTWGCQAIAIPLAEATSRKHHADFERWLGHETPEQRADREARYTAEEVANLEAVVAVSGEGA